MDDRSRRRDVTQLRSCDKLLWDAYDLAMLDLDGVVYRGDDAVPHAAAALTEAHERTRLAYVTNNASRPPRAVVSRLRALDIPVEDAGVVTSAQAAARLVASMVGPGSAVLVIGGEGLVDALTEHGLRAVDGLDQDPAAVVQGFDPGIGWSMLAEGAYAVEAGLPWVASNTDMTVPTARGIAPGNGSLVAAVAAATGAVPYVAGKPEPPLFDETILRVGGRHPLVVGDRLDTDIEGANAVGADSLLVLTGVSDLAAAVDADPRRRPTFVGADLRSLGQQQRPVDVSAGRATCGGMSVVLDGDVLRVETDRPDEDVTSLLRATLALAWATGPQTDVSAVQEIVSGQVR